MKKSLLTALFFCLISLAVYSQNNPTIQIVNNTGYDILCIFASPSSDEEWGDDLLGEEILEDGQTVTIALSLPLSTESVYDILCLDEDMDEYYKFEVRISNNIRLVFTEDDLAW